MEFEGTAEVMRINIANADLAIGRGDIDGALTMLREISPDQVCVSVYDGFMTLLATISFYRKRFDIKSHYTCKLVAKNSLGLILILTAATHEEYF